jgi:hypothetical protein
LLLRQQQQQQQQQLKKEEQPADFPGSYYSIGEQDRIFCCVHFTSTLISI